jgi:RecA-family ATPase
MTDDNVVVALNMLRIRHRPPTQEELDAARDYAANKSDGDLDDAWIDMSRWDHEPVPERKWAIKDRAPLNQAGLFSGEGGTGKSIIELTKDVAHVAGKDWFGSLPECGPAIYIGAEDEEDELHRRLAAIAQHYGVTFAELVKSGLYVLCKLGQDATLCAVTRKSGRVETTDFYRQLYEAAGDIKPINISIDTLSRAFFGNELDRSQVYTFAMHMQALAMVARGSVTVLSHPSLQGIASGSGLSGSTAWHGAFRFRQYLKGVKPDEDSEEADSDVRELAFKKNQYGPIGETLVLRWQRGLFLPEPRADTIEEAAANSKIDNLFLDLLRRFTKQGRNVSPSRSPTYAPTQFEQQPEAKAAKVKSRAFAQAMERLLLANKIKVVNEGSPSRRRDRLVESSFEETVRTRIIGEVATGVACVHCHDSDGVVLKIKKAEDIGGKPQPLHEACAEAWFRGLQP